MGLGFLHSSDITPASTMGDALALRDEPLSVEQHLILGCSPLAGIYHSIPETQAFDTVKAALDLGFRDFDTAPHYGLGLSEARLGKALERHARDAHGAVRLWSKVGRVTKPSADVTSADEPHVERGNVPGAPGCIFPDAPADVTPVLDYSGDGARRSYADSVSRLGIVAAQRGLHGLRVHDAEDEARYAAAVAEGGAVDALRELRNEHDIAAVSLGMNDPAYVLRMIAAKPAGTFDNVMIAGAWNLIDQDGLELLLSCQKRGIKVHNAGIFASGLLVGGDRYKYQPAPSGILVRRAKWQALAQSHGVPLPAVAIAFALAPAVVEKAAVGVQSPEEVRANAEWLAAAENVPPRLWREAKERGLLGNDIPTPTGETKETA